MHIPRFIFFHSSSWFSERRRKRNATYPIMVRFCSLVLLLRLVGGFAFMLQEDTTSYITWDDLTVSTQRLHWSGEASKSSMGRVIVVDKNGAGDANTVQGAVDMVPEYNAERIKIHVLPGVYREKVNIPASKPYISIIGDQNHPWATVITWHDKALDSDGHGGRIGTLNSATVTVLADYFCATGITIENTVTIPSPGVEGYQAVALRVAGDKSVLYKARFLGSQDTLLDETGVHYFFQCFVQGTTDFIFGNARSLYEECTISVVGYAYAIAAQKRSSAAEDTGFSFVSCNIVGNGEIYLGRAWGEYSRVMYSRCLFNINIVPLGWSDWSDPFRQRTVEFGEYQCLGKGADRSGRAPWSKALSYREANWYMSKTFISGERWLRI